MNIVKKLKVLYSCSGYGKIEIPGTNITTNDKYIKSDIMKDCTTVNYNNYDIIVASPPCNYWSKANYKEQREKSKYAQETKHLLQWHIDKASQEQKPMIIENVINRKLIEKELKVPVNINIVINGRHTYFSNKNIEFIKKFIFEKSCNIAHKSTRERQGDNQVKTVFEKFIKIYGLKEEENNIQLNMFTKG